MPASFCLFSSFPHYTIQIYIDLSIDGMLGFKPGTAEWNVQMNPLSYGSTPVTKFNLIFTIILGNMNSKGDLFCYHFN